MAIVTRSGKGSPLTTTEMDGNFTYLEELSSGGGSPSIARPYKVYSAILSQGLTASPIATVLENSLGNIVWTRYNVGEYVGTLAGAFLDSKTHLVISTNGGGPQDNYQMFRNGEDEVNIITFKTGAVGDDALAETAIEIRVYN